MVALLSPPAHEMASLDEQLGLLLVVRIASVLLVLTGALFASGAAGIEIGQVWPLCAGFMFVAAVGETARRHGWPGGAVVHRALVPADGLFLTVVVAAAGGPHSPLIALFAVQIVSVMLLAGTVSGAAITLWDTLLFVLLPTARVTVWAAGLLGVRDVAVPGVEATAPAIAGFWVLALFTALFASVSQRELRRSKAEMSSLAEMASELEQTDDESEILAVLLSALVETFGLNRATLWYDNGARQTAMMMDGPGHRVAECPPPVRDAAALPISVDGTEWGYICLDEHGLAAGPGLSRRTVEMAKQFVGHADLVLRNARLLAELARQATVDGLTGLANRREFDTVMAREVSRCRRTDEPLALALFDVDHFKQINDSRGHLGGDEVLRILAALLRDSVRDMDVVARFGGEEFAIILPRCTRDDAVQVVKRITEACNRSALLDGVTLSAGVAAMPINATDAQSLVSAADEALYVSKRAGRDRFTISGRRPVVAVS